MPRVKMQDVLTEHESDIRRAMKDVLKKFAPELEPNAHAITKEFIRAVGRKTSTWTRVRDTYVEVD